MPEFEEFTPADTWILTLYSFLQNKYKVSPGEFLAIEFQGEKIIVKTDGTRLGDLFASEAWRAKAPLQNKGLGLKVVSGGEIFAELPPANKNKGNSMLQQTDVSIEMQSSEWLQQKVRGVYHNLQRIKSYQKNDGTVYVVSAHSGDNNIIKGVFPFLGLADVLSTESVLDLAGKPVNYSGTVQKPGCDHPGVVGEIRARVIREGVATGYYAESYDFKYLGVPYKMEAEYMTIDSDKEAIVVVRNLDLIQRGFWLQRSSL